MYSFTTALATLVVSATSVMAGTPSSDMTQVAAAGQAEPIAATIFTEKHYEGLVQQVHQVGHCYGIAEGDPWYHDISSIQVHHGYKCDVYAGPKCDHAQILEESLEGSYGYLSDLGIDDVIEGIKCSTIPGSPL